MRRVALAVAFALLAPFARAGDDETKTPPPSVYVAPVMPLAAKPPPIPPPSKISPRAKPPAPEARLPPESRPEIAPSDSAIAVPEPAVPEAAPAPPPQKTAAAVILPLAPSATSEFAPAPRRFERVPYGADLVAGAWSAQAAVGHAWRFAYGVRFGYDLTDYLLADVEFFRSSSTGGTTAVHVATGLNVVEARLSWLYQRGPIGVLLGAGPIAVVNSVTYSVVDNGQADGPASRVSTDAGLVYGGAVRYRQRLIEFRLDALGVRRGDRGDFVMLAGLGVAF